MLPLQEILARYLEPQRTKFVRVFCLRNLTALIACIVGCFAADCVEQEIVAASLMVEVAESTLSSGMAAKAPALTSGEVAYVGEGKLGAVCFSRLLARGDGHAGVVAFAHSRGARSSPTAGACTFRTGSVRVAGTAVAQVGYSPPAPSFCLSGPVVCPKSFVPRMCSLPSCFVCFGQRDADVS